MKRESDPPFKSNETQPAKEVASLCSSLRERGEATSMDFDTFDVGERAHVSRAGGNE